jgi:hypothetical protein
VENPEIASAVFWLSWLNLIKNWGAVLIVVGGAAALLADWFSAPLTKKVEDARTAELARLNNETARLSKEAENARALIADADARAAEANRSVALANTSNLATAEILALTMGLRSPEAIGEVAKPFLIILKVKPFAGKQFNAVVTSRDLNRVAFLNSLRNALKEAGWIEVGVREQSSADHASVRGVRIDVDGSKDSTLLDAADALASALSAEGIAATANQTPETDAANANVIHILVGPKAD